MSALRDLRLKAGLSQQELAERAGTSQPQIKRLESGDRKLTREWAERLAKPLGVSPQDILFGRAAKPPAAARGSSTASGAHDVREVPVVAEVAAGLWHEGGVWDEAKYDPVPVVPGKYAALEQRAYMVRGPSMDLKQIFDGDFVIGVPYQEARIAPLAGDLVIVVRRDGSLYERTVKELVITPERFELWPRSSDPRFQRPIVIERDENAFDEGSIEITDLVIGTFRRF